MAPSPLRRPSVLIPFLVSLLAIALIAIHALASGTRGDEAHTIRRVFWLLMIAQAPLVGFFAIRWLPEDPRKGAPVVIAQVMIAIIAIVVMLILT